MRRQMIMSGLVVAGVAMTLGFPLAQENVAEIEQVKGLEFDYVIVVDVSADQFPDSPLARRRLNVAATRAIHQLWVTCIGVPSPLLESPVGASA